MNRQKSRLKAVAVGNSLLEKFSGKFRRCWKIPHRFSGSTKCYPCQGLGTFRARRKTAAGKLAAPAGTLLDFLLRDRHSLQAEIRLNFKRAFRPLRTPIFMVQDTLLKLRGLKFSEPRLKFSSEIEKAHKLLTHKLCLPPFVPGMSPGQTGFVPGTNWASAV